MAKMNQTQRETVQALPVGTVIKGIKGKSRLLDGLQPSIDGRWLGLLPRGGVLRGEGL